MEVHVCAESIGQQIVSDVGQTLVTMPTARLTPTARVWRANTAAPVSQGTPALQETQQPTRIAQVVDIVCSFCKTTRANPSAIILFPMTSFVCWRVHS